MKQTHIDWLHDRVTTGWLFRKIWPETPIRLGHTHCFILQHPTLNVFYRDPYLNRESSRDPRNQWTTRPERAYRFATEDAALSCLQYQWLDGRVVRHEL